ncbi:MAG: hypothetical protein EZS28_003640 [Streblomastix strix]|uniref:Uncharacterized protein n=1 Tax=Streblomastix strix TaxID=222440 RepID=A0A5J4X191_9EUKA|nr:MAG: hypothetical protein EZS28_003640 [Streblomastix strix]
MKERAKNAEDRAKQAEKSSEIEKQRAEQRTKEYEEQYMVSDQLRRDAEEKLKNYKKQIIDAVNKEKQAEEDKMKAMKRTQKAEQEKNNMEQRIQLLEEQVENINKKLRQTVKEKKQAELRAEEAEEQLENINEKLRQTEEEKKQAELWDEKDEENAADEEVEQEVLTTNDSGKLVVTVVKTKKGQAYYMRPQERDRENKMLDDLFRNRNLPGSVQSVGMSAATQPWVYSQQMNPEDAQFMSYTYNGFVPQPDPLDTYGMDGVGSKPKGTNQNWSRQGK